jgi:hypothetical protein
MSASRRGVRVLFAVAIACVVATGARPAAARELKLWPLFDYTTDAETGATSLKILGPLIEYGSDPKYRRVAVRPFFSIRQARVGHDDEVRVLYPLLTSRWGVEEQTTRALGGLVTYETRTTTDGRTLTRQSLRALPFYFYEWDGEHGGRASLVPFYADIDDIAGYERVQMILFPGYLRLQQPRYDRRYWLYPFYSAVGGPGGSGYALWPAYGRMAVDDTYQGGFVAWPFYVWDTYTTGDESERHVTSFPFYSTVDGPRRRSTAYGAVLYVHSRDRDADVERFGFPSPVWEYERTMTTGATRTLRMPPFYQQRRLDDSVHAYRRTDGLVVLFHDERTTDLATGTTAHARALFPAFADEGAATWDRGGSPALLDAMLPHDAGVREMYAPLWRAYGWDGPVDAPRVSLAWGAVTREHGTTVYPWHWDAATER